MKTFSQLRNNKLQESVVMYSAKKSEEPAARKTDTEAPQENTAFGRVLNSMQTNTPQTFKLNDGTTIQITPMEAKNIMYTYEELNDSNQGIFESMINNSINTYELIVEFCNSYAQ